MLNARPATDDNSMIPYLEDMVGYGVPVDVLTVLLLVHVVGHTDLLSEANKKYS